MCVMIAFYTLVFMIFMSDAICIARFMVCFYLGYFVGAMCRREDRGSMVLRRILFKCKVSSVTTCFAGK